MFQVLEQQQQHPQAAAVAAAVHIAVAATAVVILAGVVSILTPSVLQRMHILRTNKSKQNHDEVQHRPHEHIAAAAATVICRVRCGWCNGKGVPPRSYFVQPLGATRPGDYPVSERS